MADEDERQHRLFTRRVEVHSQTRDSIIADLVKALLALWIPFLRFDSPDLVSGHVARSTNLVDVSLTRARRNARSFVIATLDALDARPSALPPQRDLYPRSGTSTTEVYHRPVERYLYEISRGRSDEEARKAALERLEKIARRDVLTADRDEIAGLYQAAPKVIGFRRVLHPELTQHGPCGLCVVAANRVYQKEDLMDLHGGCVCEPVAITADSDPGLRLNQEDLERIYAAVGSTNGRKLARTRVQFNEHGELGPVLTYDGQNWRDVAALNKDSTHGKVFTPYQRPTVETQRESWEKMRASSQRSVAALKAARASGADTVTLSDGSTTKVRDWDQAIKFHTDLIDRMTSKLR